MKTTLRAPRKNALVRDSESHTDAMIELRGVIKQFSNAAGVFTVLKGVDLTINRGEFVSIVGKSGSGKSTLLNMVTGIDHPTEGKIRVAGPAARWSRTPSSIRSHPPTLGEHGDDILREAGFSESDIEALAGEGAMVRRRD